VFERVPLGRRKKGNTSKLVKGRGKACYAVGERRQDEGNGWIKNYSDCER
jgi:hypothetical protein